MEYAGAILQSTRRLAALITNILKINKLENQQIFPKHEQYDLSGQLCEALLGFEDVWEEKGLNIETRIEDEVVICSDRELLSLVWSNLISNAVKFTPAGGTIGVSLVPEGRHVLVSVTDTGCGIEERAQGVGQQVICTHPPLAQSAGHLRDRGHDQQLHIGTAVGLLPGIRHQSHMVRSEPLCALLQELLVFSL